MFVAVRGLPLVSARRASPCGGSSFLLTEPGSGRVGLGKVRLPGPSSVVVNGLSCSVARGISDQEIDNVSCIARQVLTTTDLK